MKGLFLGLIAVLISICTSLGHMNSLAYEPDWGRSFYNPNENPDGKDFILPLPAGGAVTFRPVAIIQNSVIEAKYFSLGNAKFVPDEYPLEGSISGVFDTGQKRVRLFYIGKYEITESQYDAVMHGKKLQELSRKPKVDVSWFKAVQFCHKLTIWLLKNHKELMPMDDNIPGYIRLPTEEEWEFACRGGEVVTANFFYRDHFVPDDESEAEYVQYYRSGDVKKLQSIGKTEKPNPLGLYDMLGNAGEICFNLFRLNYHYGRSGGYVIKGGHFKLLDPGNLRSSIRFEVPFYDDRQAESNSSKYHSFRVLIAAPLYTSLQRGEKIKEQWVAGSLPSSETMMASFAEAHKKINFVSNRIQDVALKNELDVIRHSFENIAREINEIELKDAKSFFRLGAYCFGTVATQSNKLRTLQAHLEDRKKKYQETKSKYILKLKNSVRKLTDARMNDLESYGDAVESLNAKYRTSPDLVVTAYNQVIEKKRLQKRENQIPAVKLVLKHTEAFSQRNAALWLKDIIDEDTN